MFKYILIALSLLTANHAFSGSINTIPQDCLRIQDGICIDKNELGMVDGVTSNIQTQINGLVSDTAYDATSWNGVTAVAPSKNAVRDQIEAIIATIPSVSDTAYNATSWDGVTTIAPSKNAVRDQFELKANLASPALTGSPTAPTQTASDNSTKIATTAYVDTADALDVHLAGSQTITGAKTFTGQLLATSTTFGNKPCPDMTDAQMLAIPSPQNGWCVFNTTKKSQYVYDSVTSKWKANGGGGGAGTRYELMTDPSFEDGVTEGTCSGCTASQEATTLVITPTNEKALKLAFSASAGSYTVDKTVTSYMLGADATVGIWINAPAAATSCYFKERVNGADTGNSTLINNDGVPHYYEWLPKIGATSIGYKIDCTASITANLIADESTIRIDKRLSLLANIAMPRLMGVTKITGCAGYWTGPATTYAGFTAQTSCVYTNEGLATTPSTMIPAFTFASLPPGDYVVEYNGEYDSNGTNEQPFMQFYDGTIATRESDAPFSNISYNGGTTLRQSFSYTAPKSNVTIQVRGKIATGGIRIAGTTGVPGVLKLWYFPTAQPNYLTAPDTFSTDANPLTYASSATYTESTLANAPVGTFITYTIAASSNTRTQTTTAPTQTISDMATNGIKVFTRSYSALSTAGNPTQVAIQVGKNQKGETLRLYKSAARATHGAMGYYFVNGSGGYGITYSYNESSGVLTIDGGISGSGSETSRDLVFPDGTTSTSGYVTVNESKNPALTGMNATPHPVATIKDVKTSGTNGGTFTSGAWQTRTLNTLNDPFGIVTSLSSNQFILPSGRYLIESSAAAYSVETHRSKIKNITDSTDDIFSMAAYAPVADNSENNSILSGIVSITSPKTFELQHRCTTTGTTTGFGASGGISEEVYTQIKITKLSP